MANEDLNPQVKNLGEELEMAGKELGKVGVKVGPRFLNLFSQQLYSSPNKAFEELVSNSWDAGAETVYIHVPNNLKDPDATIWVLDNGVSMNADGLQELWNVAQSPKADRKVQYGRKPIGKFGIGKLATYILTNELTYVCKFSDGIIRAVTMDYRKIDSSDVDELTSDRGIELSVRELAMEELLQLIEKHDSNGELIQIIKDDVPKVDNEDAHASSEFGDEEQQSTRQVGTWTLVLLTALKDAGQNIQSGMIRRILRTSLPLGNSMTIIYNAEQLQSVKSDIPHSEWKFGSDFPIDEFLFSKEGHDDKTYSILKSKEGEPSHIRIEGMGGPMTGSIKIFDKSISNAHAKSEGMGYSNGFVINVLGRIINIDAPYFGLKNLQHTTWSMFRCSLRADWLDKYINVTREDVQDVIELDVFRSFLLACFNKARAFVNSEDSSARDAIGESLIKSYSALPLEPVHRFFADSDNLTELPEFIISQSGDDLSHVVEEFARLERKDYAKMINRVSLNSEMSPEEHLYKYNLQSKTLEVNSNHPFAKEHSETKEQKQLLQDMALVELLTDIFIIDSGISEETSEEIRRYRELVLRILAKVSRRTGSQIADLLDIATSHDKALEAIVGDALEYFGFEIKRLAQPGEPEGVATAVIPATFVIPSEESNEAGEKDDKQLSYSFTYDAKSTKHKRASTNNINIANMAQHRRNHNADYTLVVAPDFQDGQLGDLCETSKVTPMRARDLKKLLLIAISSGPFDLNKFKEIFNFHNPEDVGKWIEEFDKHMSQPRFTLGMLLEVISSIPYNAPESISTTVISHVVRSKYPQFSTMKSKNIKSILTGLEVLFPHLLIVEKDKIHLSTTPQQIRQQILSQIKDAPSRSILGVS